MGDMVMQDSERDSQPATGSPGTYLNCDDGDTRMRGVSEEPSAPIAMGAAATSKSASLNGGTGITRNPSVRAQNAFSRLRIGSFGATPRPSFTGNGNGSSPGSPTSEAGSSTSRGRAPAPEKYQSPAASFLSAFSPPSSVGSGGGRRSPSPPRRGYAAISLPPRGNEAGFRLRVHSSDGPGADAADEWEYELGRELGQGGMGLVREAVRRRAGAMSDADPRPGDETRVAVKIIPRRHPHFVSLAALRESLAAGGAGLADGDARALVQHFHPAPSPSSSPGAAKALGAGPRRASLRGVAMGMERDHRADVERSRSTSSPMRPHVAARAASMAPIENPAPSPPADEGMLGTSAPGQNGGYFPGAGARSDGGDRFDDGEDADGAVDLLDLLLQREISLWRQLSHLVPAREETHLTRWSGRGGHPHIVALLDTHRTAEFDYVFMPLAEGGTLLEYVTRPELRDREPTASSTGSGSASSAASSASKRSASRGRGKPRRARGSIPIAGTSASSSPPASSASPSGPAGLLLRDAGEAFLQVADAVRWLHDEARVVHRDLKLENVVGCWEAPPAAGASPRGRRRRVWKLADFGLSEVIPDPRPAAPASASSGTGKSPVEGVQPLSALARAGSLSRPTGGYGHDHALAASVGPGAPLSAAATRAAANSGLSASAFLPSPHRAQSPTAPPPPGSANSPVTALLHPVGSLPYSSPEALRSPVPIVHPSVDIWALGCVLYALVAGRLPIWDDWEHRLRVRLVKGEWDVPAELDPTQAHDQADAEERQMALEVLRGCLKVDVGVRWSIEQVCDSAWLARVRTREADERKRAEVPLSPTGTGGRTLSRGRPSTRAASVYAAAGGGPPPAPSTGASEHSHSGSQSQSRKGATAGGSGTTSQSRSRTRLATRSSSRSSAYAHQFGAAGGSDSADRERRERGRSERRARWDEERGAGGAGGGTGRRSASRASSGGAGGEEEGAVPGPRRGRSGSRTAAAQAAGRGSATGSSRDSRERREDGSGTPTTVLETVGEPY